jgi:HK97 family phage prohead protease
MSILPIEGYACVYGIMDKNDRMFVPGAFEGWLSEDPAVNVPLLWYHLDGSSMPIGMTTEIRSDDIGLWFAAEIADTAAGRDAAALIPMGGASGASHHFYGLGRYTDDFEQIIESAMIDEVSIMAPGRQANLLATAGIAGEFVSPAIQYAETIEAVKQAMMLVTAA